MGYLIVVLPSVIVFLGWRSMGKTSHRLLNKQNRRVWLSIVLFFFFVTGLFVGAGGIHLALVPFSIGIFVAGLPTVLYLLSPRG